MQFKSILDLGPAGPATQTREQPSCLHDLNLDQMVAQIATPRARYDIAPLFYGPVATVDAIRYRHEALRDLESEGVLAAVQTFVEQMAAWRDQRARMEKLHYAHQRERVLVSTVGLYCDAVRAFAARLAALEVRSRAFDGLRQYLLDYVEGPEFKSLLAETEQVVEGLAKVRYTVHVRGGRVTVARYEGEDDYSAEIAAIFAKFRRPGDEPIPMEVPNPSQMNHVETQIIDRVEQLHPEVFAALHSYCERHAEHLDPVVGRFEREVQFYLGYLEYIERLKDVGLAFCHPRVSARLKEIEVEDGFDLVLAAKRSSEAAVVVNGLRLSGAQRILVVTGPNNGGKTTFARMVGQLHYLASLGLPVPAASARLMLPDRVFTHFEREEDIATLRGKLDDELVRIREILQQATGSSLIVMNESFSSTTLSDALFLGTEVIGRIVERDCLAVYVTFVDELASLNDATVSMVATVAPDDPSVRTFRVVPQPANGLAYAAAIAQKYGLTYESVRRRVAS